MSMGWSQRMDITKPINISNISLEQTERAFFADGRRLNDDNFK
ncbi:MAG: hypothetical protein AB7S48_17200 [Bacteroidales bacterium]